MDWNIDFTLVFAILVWFLFWAYMVFLRAFYVLLHGSIAQFLHLNWWDSCESTNVFDVIWIIFGLYRGEGLFFKMKFVHQPRDGSRDLNLFKQSLCLVFSSCSLDLHQHKNSTWNSYYLWHQNNSGAGYDSKSGSGVTSGWDSSACSVNVPKRLLNILLISGLCVCRSDDVPTVCIEHPGPLWMGCTYCHLSLKLISFHIPWKAVQFRVGAFSTAAWLVASFSKGQKGHHFGPKMVAATRFLAVHFLFEYFVVFWSAFLQLKMCPSVLSNVRAPNPAVWPRLHVVV